VHLPTPDWLDGSMAGYVETAEAYFRSRVERQSLDELAAKYQALDATAVLLAWDAETATGRPRVPNSTVAAAVREHPGAFAGIGSVDPHKESAVDEVAEIAALGLRGVKFHPSLQAFAPDDEKFWPVFAACEAHGLLALFHTGTSGIGARQPGGQGIRIDYAHPLKLDSVAAAFPGLTVVAAHFGWPWHMDLLAMALHKTNVYIDISGWSPRRIPAEVTRELKGRLADQFVWGSDYPFIAPERCLGELEELGLDSPVLLHDNAARILGLPALPSGLDQCERDRHLLCDRSAPLDARHLRVCEAARVHMAGIPPAALHSSPRGLSGSLTCCLAVRGWPSGRRPTGRGQGPRTSVRARPTRVGRVPGSGR
jgi:predicted TIM-barrel fold metal-dependent hydrolase